jgi:hypothetical protein
MLERWVVSGVTPFDHYPVKRGSLQKLFLTFKDQEDSLITSVVIFLLFLWLDSTEKNLHRKLQ